MDGPVGGVYAGSEPNTYSIEITDAKRTRILLRDVDFTVRSYSVPDSFVPPIPLSYSEELGLPPKHELRLRTP